MIVPKLGLGAFRLSGQTVIDSVKTALEVGYRAVDTAQIYANEAEVGQAIAESQLNRDKLFITTKIWTENYAPDKLISSLKDSLRKLRTDAVNLTLLKYLVDDQEFMFFDFLGGFVYSLFELLMVHTF